MVKIYVDFRHISFYFSIIVYTEGICILYTQYVCILYSWCEGEMGL